MLLIPQNANGELRPGDVTKLDGTCEKEDKQKLSD